MSIDSRNECIDAYFSALDEEDPELARSVLADDFVYESLAGDLDGFEGLSEYITDLRTIRASTHAIDHRIHDDERSAVEGVVTGTGPGGDSVEAGFCDVFEFDADETAITRVAVYANDA